MGLDNEGLGAESFCALLIASLDDEIKSCCEFKSLGKIERESEGGIRSSLSPESSGFLGRWKMFFFQSANFCKHSFNYQRALMERPFGMQQLLIISMQII